MAVESNFKEHKGLTEPVWFRNVLILTGLGFLFIFLVIPLGTVFYEGFRKGVQYYFSSIFERSAFAAIKLTLLITVIVVPLNTVFGLLASWAIARFNFRGKTMLITLIDIPFSVSPVISGMIFVMLFGSQGLFGTWLIEHNLKIIFAWPGIVLATWFVTFPFVSREIIPVLNVQGKDEEEAAALMGAKGFTIFRKITFPHMKWGLIYGIILCTARALGEFGAVNALSKTRGETFTLPLEIDAQPFTFLLRHRFRVIRHADDAQF